MHLRQKHSNRAVIITVQITKCLDHIIKGAVYIQISKECNVCGFTDFIFFNLCGLLVFFSLVICYPYKNS